MSLYLFMYNFIKYRLKNIINVNNCDWKNIYEYINDKWVKNNINNLKIYGTLRRFWNL